MAKAKIGILSLGCPRNLVDSENILGRLQSKGYPIVDIDKADIAVVNTCAFLEDAKVESIDAILDLVNLKKEGRLKKIIVYGCLSERYKQSLKKELPEVDAFVGRVALNHDLHRLALTPKHYAYLKICEGCINNCSYCIIPKIKSRFTSLDTRTIFKKIEELEETGVCEVNIIGQDITGFGMDLYENFRLKDLIKKILQKSKHIRWFRLLYLYPSRVDEDLLELINSEPRICKYIDLPLQHINGRILRLMNRKTTKNDILKLISKIRKILPDVALRTSLIVGFPSETDKEFKELLDFIRQAKFEKLGAFLYSREEGTRAYDFKKQVPEKIKMQRFNAIMSVQQAISAESNRGLLGRQMEVLIDERKEDYYLGRTQYDAPEVDGVVYVRSGKELKPGNFVRVKITDTLEYDLAGEVKDEFSQ
jgi:ribosomal protein S12 methylthiotransferase